MKTNTNPRVLLALLWLLTLLPARAVPDGYIWIDMSVKFVLNPATGNVPAGTDEANFKQVVALMNRWLAATWRGYRIRLVDLDANQKIKRIGGLNDTTGPGKWYSTDLKGEGTVSAQNNLAFENAAKANASYGWNTNALNLYINNGGWSSAQFPSSGRGLVISSYLLISDNSSPEFYKTNNYKIAGNILHECGHFFELYHTFGGPGTPPNDDAIPDTALDLVQQGGRNETVVRNDIAALNGWGTNYSLLTLERKRLVDNTANNIMSYYQLFYDDPAQGKIVTDAERFGYSRFLFTEDQNDKWADNANVQRASVSSGTTRFVGPNGAILQTGSSSAPYRLLADGITSASSSGNDIVLMKPGTYKYATLTKPMTLRATHDGPAIITKP